ALRPPKHHDGGNRSSKDCRRDQQPMSQRPHASDDTQVTGIINERWSEPRHQQKPCCWSEFHRVSLCLDWMLISSTTRCGRRAVSALLLSRPRCESWPRLACPASPGSPVPCR